ncbi:MAG: M4 family metallopeptidase, partial [Myxococcota bacterium]
MSLCAALTVSSLFAQLAPGGVAPSSGQTGHYEVVRRADGNGRITGALFALEPDVDAREGLQPFFPELGLSDEDQLRLVDDVTDELGQRHLRYRRDRRGIEVKHDQVRVHANREHVVTRIEMELSELSAYRHRTPRIAPDTAIERARQGFTGKLSTPPRATLVVLGRVPLTGPRLAYEVPIVYPRSGQVPYARDVYVDAADGRVLMSLSRIFSQAATMNDTALDGVTRNIRVTRNASQNSVVMQDRVTIPDGGVMVTLNGNAGETNYVTPDTNTSFDDPTAVSVHHVVRESVEFLDREYGWNTWDFDSEPAGPGGTLFAIAHEGDNLPNAFFFLAESGSQLTGVVAFGDGDGLITTELARCQDVATHEVAHGLVTATANLAYEFQSGALNESFADVFGWLNDQEDDGIGEDCIGSLLQTPLRDMCNPGDVDQPQPAHMDDFQILPNTEEGNFGGVHINSGIPNRAACISRDAIGPRDVGRIWFRALRFHLGPTSKFQDMVDATATACSELSLPTSTCAAVAQAWNTVGLEPSVIEGPTLDCPLNSTQNGTQCFCDPGFVPTPTGAG